MMSGRTWIGGAIGVILLTAVAADGILGISPRDYVLRGMAVDSQSDLEGFRDSGDLPSQRRHVWRIVEAITSTVNAGARPAFESWYGEDAAFAKAGAEQLPRGIRGFSREDAGQDKDTASGDQAARSVDIPILAYTLYNRAAYDHIRNHRLQFLSELKRLSNTGPPDSSIAGDRSIPSFPPQAIVLKTAWWPVAHDGLTALPVWDPERNVPRPSGNPYTSWQRVVAVDPSGNSRTNRASPIEFAGRTFRDVHQVRLNEFHYVIVDAELAKRLARDRSAAKAALVVLGRRIEVGDYLVLVGMNLATKELPDWVWGTLWWHDRADESPFAADRPSVPDSEWRNYLLQVAFDSNKPDAFDGGPHICFNPWLEGRFPDGGHGGGIASNCLTCHRRASYSPVGFLPVTRGAPNLSTDPAYARGQLRTNFIWSIALHARP
jgi:hypothetical protein